MLFQYNPWGKGHGNPPMFDRQGRMVKPTRDRDGDDLVSKSPFFNRLNPRVGKWCLNSLCNVNTKSDIEALFMFLYLMFLWFTWKRSDRINQRIVLVTKKFPRESKTRLPNKAKIVYDGRFPFRNKTRSFSLLSILYYS